MSKPFDRPAKEPGGCECIDCGEIFIGEPWHDRCAICIAAWNTRAAEQAKDAQIAELVEALEVIADIPDPGEGQERSATFYRIHAAMIKQIAANALGRKTVSDEAMQWAENWWNSTEGIEARALIAKHGGNHDTQ